MKQKHPDPRVEKSLKWIRRNWLASNLDVPERLLRQWIQHQAGADQEPDSFHLSVFGFGYFGFKLISSDASKGDQIRVSSTEFFHQFNLWQIKLSLAAIHRHTDVKTSPLPLFAFSGDELIDIWQGASIRTVLPNWRLAEES